MQRILIPTDFSNNSWNAIKYCVQLFKDAKCTFFLLHVNPIPPYSGAASSVKTSTVVLKDSMIKESKVELKKLQRRIKDFSDNNNHSFNITALYDYFVES
ncbi:MAG: universal stress protein, partial [Flavobacteriaceae bacterium]